MWVWGKTITNNNNKEGTHPLDVSRLQCWLWHARVYAIIPFENARCVLGWKRKHQRTVKKDEDLSDPSHG